MRVNCLFFGPHVSLPGRLGDALLADGCAVEGVGEPDAFRARVRSGQYALGFVRADWPTKAGALDALRDLRRVSSMPCILVDATPLPAGERVAALDAGADEVLDAAVPLSEAVARVRAVLRRCAPAAAVAAAAAAHRPARDVWRLSPGVRLVHGPDGGSHRLTAAEFDLLRLLIEASGRAVCRDAISREAFRRPWHPEDRAVDGLVKRLRRKLGPDSILASRGVGYALAIQIHSP
ncbi:MAG: response regulator transcription factor [Acetobacteraceae bacterium]|nr:response regulator transcription factor [Acetobacteraceae bacterium]